MDLAVTRERIPQAERSARMRAKLSRAAFEVIRDDGYAGFRTAAVSRTAGVSQGAQLHHFPTKNSLAQAAIDYAWEQVTAQSLERVAAFEAGGDIIRAILNDSMAFFFSDYFLVALDILMAGGRDAELRAGLVNSTLVHRQNVERKWLAKLVDEGWALDDGEQVLALTLSMVRGLAIRDLVQPDPDKCRALCERWHAIIGSAFPR